MPRSFRWPCQTWILSFHSNDGSNPLINLKHNIHKHIPILNQKDRIVEDYKL
jgi:hypothetical protein